MNKIRLIMLAGLCLFIAVLSIGFVSVDMKSKEPATQADKNMTSSADITEAQVTAENTTAEAETTTEAVSTTKPEATAEPQTVSNYKYAYAGFNPTVAVVNSEKWNLLLVNQDYILPSDFTVKTETVKGGSCSLDYRVVPYYNDMVTAAAADGINLIPVSGFRSVEKQQANFERKINYYTTLGYSKAEATRLAAKIVLMPGSSEHNAGLAMDFGTDGNTSLEESFAQTNAFKWLSEHAADYGFILRYEKQTQSITKVTYEPWHWRYVGVDVAKEIKASGVTLEEYLGAV